MTTRAIATSTLWQIASQAVMAILSTISVKFVAVGLSRELAGAYNSAYGYLQLFAILADFGLYAVSVREVAAAKDHEHVLGGLIVLRTIIATLSLGAAFTIAWIIPIWTQSPLPIAISIASLVPFFTLLAGVLRTVFQIRFKMHLAFIAEVLQRVLSTGLMALIVISGIRLSSDVTILRQFLWAGAFGALLLFILSLFFALRLMRIRPCFDRALLRSLLKKAAPYGVAFLCIALYRQCDLTLIALLRKDFALQNASYGFASRIAEMTYLVPTFLLNSTLPVLAKRHEEGQKTEGLLGKTLLLILILGSASAVFSAFWARPIMGLLTTPAYLARSGIPGADTALSVLAIPMFANGIVLYSFYTFLTVHAWRSLVRWMSIGVVLSVISNLLLIPRFGFVGAGIASTITQIFLACCLLPQAQHHLRAVLPAIGLQRWMIFTAVLALFAIITAPLLSTPLLSIVGLIIGTLVCAGLCMVLGLHRLLIGLPSKGDMESLEAA
jgi:O-antigen/teichoic acid export membrane protein